jgi:isocitrate/isopropylmalate dehydrogenase
MRSLAMLLCHLAKLKKHGSHELASCDRVLFGSVEKKREQKDFRSEKEMISAVRTGMKTIAIRILSKVF